MKKIYLIFIFLAAVISSKAEEEQTLIGSLDDVKIGFYGSFDMKTPFIHNGPGLMLGGSGGLIINESFSIGAGGWGLSTNHFIDDFQDPVYNNATMSMGYGGFIFEYFNSPRRLIHFNASLFMGWGGASVVVDNPGTNNRFALESASFFAVEPGISAEMNVTRFFRLGIGASYRIAGGLNTKNLEDSDVSGFNVNLKFRFGNFTRIDIPDDVKEVFD